MAIRFGSHDRRKRPPRNYLSRREQYRLLFPILALGIVILLIVQAAKPENWAWLFHRGEPQAPVAAGQGNDAARPPRVAQPRPGAVPSKLPPGTVRVVPDKSAETGSVDTGFFPGVVPEYLSDVEDNRPNQPIESFAWYNLFEVLEKTDGQQLRDASLGRVSWIQLDQQPEAYRGQLVDLRGEVRRALWLTAPTNRENIEGYYQLVIMPSGGPARPLIVYSLHLPDRFPTGQDLAEPIETTAFFYKNWVYPAEKPAGSEGMNVKQREFVAPVLLARDVVWQPRPVVTHEPLNPWLLGGVVAATAVLGALLAVVAYYRNKSLYRPTQSQHDDQAVTDSLAALPDGPSSSSSSGAGSSPNSMAP